jgi:hypothetical protein
MEFWFKSINLGILLFRRVMKMNNERMEPSGHMTNNMADVIWLGKQMERMRDGMQLTEDMRFPDPIEFDEEDQTNELKHKN